MKRFIKETKAEIERFWRCHAWCNMGTVILVVFLTVWLWNIHDACIAKPDISYIDVLLSR